MSFTPLDSNFVHSTILKEGPVVSICWILLLATKDKFNESEMTPSAAAGLLRISDEEAKKAFEVLASPDLDSKNRDHDGRRIIKQDNGAWLVVSGDKYQERASKLAADLRKKKYDHNRAARAARLQPSEFICQKYGCSRPGAADIDGKVYCSAHAMEGVDVADAVCAKCGDPADSFDLKRGSLCAVHSAKAVKEDLQEIAEAREPGSDDE